VAAARSLARDYGVADRLTIDLADYALSTRCDAVDIVVMDRVVCCYPDWRRLIEQASRQAARVIALTYPRDAWWTRAGIRFVNFVQQLRRAAFRVHVHSPDAMQAALRQLGFDARVIGRHGPWEITIAARTQPLAGR
jgi:magnesium-protoporphyrin O-methyltransferase